MTYLQKNKNKRSASGIKIIVICVILLVLFRIFNINLTDGFLKNGFNYVLESKSAILSPLRNSLVYFNSKKTLEEERDQLRAENTDLKLEILTSEAVTQEFDSFRAQFTEFATDTQPIKVILKPPFMPFDMIRLSGNLESYAEGSPVYYKNVIIGTLSGKTGRYGSVQLFTSPGKVTPALIKGVQFEAKGQGGGRYTLEVPKDFELAEGDPILYPNEQVILFGVVGQLESNEEDLFKKVYFNLPVPLDSISYVTIGTLQQYEQPEPTE